MARLDEAVALQGKLGWFRALNRDEQLEIAGKLTAAPADSVIDQYRRKLSMALTIDNKAEAVRLVLRQQGAGAATVWPVDVHDVATEDGLPGNASLRKKTLHRLLNDLRAHPGDEPPVLGVPSGPNSGLSVRLP